MKIKKMLGLGLAVFMGAAMCVSAYADDKTGGLISSWRNDYVVVDGVMYSEDMTQIIKCVDSKITEFTVPDTVVRIYDRAFEYCTDLKTLVLSEKTTSYGDDIFEGCNSLNYVEIPGAATTCVSFRNCYSLDKVKILSGVKFIPDRCFENCSALKEIEIPSTVVSIGDYAFQGCSSLKSVSVPASVYTIGDYAFYCCSALETAEILSTKVKINTKKYPFTNCPSLRKFRCYTNFPVDGINSNTVIDYIDQIILSCLYGDADANQMLTAMDCAQIIQKILDNCVVMPIEEVSDEYTRYIDVADADGLITANDAAFVLQKVLDYDYLFDV